VPEPDLRILQANERTLLAWIRTGLTLMAFGFVVARISVWLAVEHPERSGSATTLLGVAVVAVGVGCHVVGALRFVRARREIVAGRTIVPDAAGPVVMAAIVAAIGVAAIVYLLVEQ
jgi:putative membrane protein